MKRFLLIATTLCFVLCSAQQVEAQNKLTAIALTTTSYTKALDTVTNTASKVTTAVRLGSWHTGVTAQAVVTKISGTVGGAIGLYGSMDGTNWSLIGSAATPTDATANYSFNTTVGWSYYRLSYTGTGTMVASVKFFLLPY